MTGVRLWIVCACLAAGGGVANAAPRVFSDSEFRGAIDACIAADAPGRACEIAGVVRRPLPRQAGRGHIVAYDAALGAFVWTVTPDPDLTTLPGQAALPPASLQRPPSRRLRAEMKRLEAVRFWMLPILAADDPATPRVGRRYTLAIETGWRDGAPQAVAVAPAPQALADHLALDIVFHARPACRGCVAAGTIERRVPGGSGTGGATQTALEHHYLHAVLDEIRFVDTADGRVVGRVTPSLREPRR